MARPLQRSCPSPTGVLSDEEINSVVDHCSTGEQNFVHELMHIKIHSEEDEDGESSKPMAFKKRDELYEGAVDIVVREGRGSCSLLQRAMGIGYGRAARLIDFMAEDGIVGQYNGSQAREVVISLAEWEAMRSGESSTSGASESAAPSARKNKIRRDEGWDESTPAPSGKNAEARSRRSVTVAAAAEQTAVDDEEEQIEEEQDLEEVDEAEEADGEEYEDEYEYEDDDEKKS